jgi:hypothetical protein
MNAFDPEKIVRALARRKVAYVLVGASAARLYGFPRLTAGADITPATDRVNLQRLAAALRDLRARVYTESVPDGLPFSCDAETLSRASLWNLITRAGRVDIMFKPSGTAGYTDLVASASTFQVFGITLRAASLKDILRSKLASGRLQDQLDATVIQEMLKQS